MFQLAACMDSTPDDKCLSEDIDLKKTKQGAI